MARRVFFSFEYDHDVWRANVVRNSWVTQGKEAAGFVDKAEFEEIKKGGDAAIKSWIDAQLFGTSVTVVLVGSHTCSSKWVEYEIDKSQTRGNGLLGINISQINDQNGQTSWCCDQIPTGNPFYHWYQDNGYKNMGDWIEKAAKVVGR
ncbi:MAG: TIR domain-containing protein [bacterium]|nr:TIR domain-containing protein [bacterium]